MVSKSKVAPVVSIVTSHGRQRLDCTADERLIDVLRRHGVPWSALSIYNIPVPGAAPVLTSCLDKRVGDLGPEAELLLYFNRNVNPFIFSLNDFTVVQSDGDPEATEYFYQRLDNAQSSSEIFLKKMSPEECREVIAERVRETIGAHLPEGAKLVVGISGGGDSNAMLYGLSQLADRGISIDPVIIKGIPDWDLGVPRAQQLCDKYGLTLTVMEEPDVRSLLGFEGEGTLVDRFEHEFAGDDFEFLGTLLIRLALIRRAKEVGTSFIATGLNLEDVLCENMFRISNGLKPTSAPARAIGDTTLIYPLWLCPKRIIDGCFPKLSMDNYNARYPCFSLGRNLYYSLIYALQSQFPGYCEQMARGLSELAAKDPVTYNLDEQLGFHVERFVPFPLRQRFQRMLSGSSVAG